jgi:protein-S-isoprenylcysteine O-methyltransferase Ste14
MQSFFNSLIACVGLAWVVYWWALSRNVKVTARGEPIFSRVSYIVPLVLSGVLVFSPSFPHSVLSGRFLPVDARGVWGSLGALLFVGGLMFTVWARLHLGRNWSDVVTLKEDHSLITSGPYAVVRHPIYTGLLIAFAGQAVARGEWRSLIGVLIAAVAFWRKLRIEERRMLEFFGAKYQTYRQKVASLIPFVR